MKDNVNGIFDRLAGWISERWLELAALVLSATRTFDIVRATSPAAWMPFAGVAVMEGGYLFWKGRMQAAKNDDQKRLSVVMSAITWVAIGLTIAADAAWQAAQRGMFGLQSLPPWGELVAVYSVVVICMLHVAALWFYIYRDPDQELYRQYLGLERDLTQQQKQAALDMRRAQINAEVAGWKRVTRQAGDLFGTQEFREAFYRRYGVYPEDLDQVEKQLPARSGNSGIVASKTGVASIAYGSEAAGGIAVPDDSGRVSGNGRYNVNVPENPTRQRRAPKA